MFIVPTALKRVTHFFSGVKYQFVTAHRTKQATRASDVHPVTCQIAHVVVVDVVDCGVFQSLPFLPPTAVRCQAASVRRCSPAFDTRDAKRHGVRS